MLRAFGVLLFVALLAACASVPGRSAEFVGAVAGISTLSADGRAIVTGATADVSLYKPQNGPALNLLAGVHLNDYLSLQATTSGIEIL